MAFKMKSGNKPTFKNMGSSPVKQTVTGKSDDGIAKVDLSEVKSWGGFTNTNADRRLPINMPGGGDYDPTTSTATNTNADKRQAKREQFSSDVNNLIEGVVGIPGTIVESIGDVGSWVGRGLKKSKIKRAERKQDKIDNPKPKKVKKVKRKSKVDGIDPTNNTGMVDVMVNGVKTSVKAKNRYKKESVKKTKKPSKIVKSLSKIAKSDAAKKIGAGVAVAGLTAGINALASRKNKTIRERPDIAAGLSNIKFGRKSRLTDET